MFDLIFNKCDSYFSVRKTLASARGAPQENDANFRYAGKFCVGVPLNIQSIYLSDMQLLHKESGNSMTITVK